MKDRTKAKYFVLGDGVGKAKGRKTLRLHDSNRIRIFSETALRCRRQRVGDDVHVLTHGVIPTSVKFPPSIYKDAVTKRCDSLHGKESASLRILMMGDLEDDVENITKK